MFLGGCQWGLEPAGFVLCSHHGIVLPSLQGGWVGVRVVVEGALPPVDSAGASLLHVKAQGLQMKSLGHRVDLSSTV